MYRCMVQMYGTEKGYSGMEVRRYGTEVCAGVVGMVGVVAGVDGGVVGV